MASTVYFVPNGRRHLQHTFTVDPVKQVVTGPPAGEPNWQCPCVAKFREGPCKGVILPAMRCVFAETEPGGTMELCERLLEDYYACTDRHGSHYGDLPL